MENKKGNVFNILLILIVIGLIGFIVYDKFIGKDNQNNVSNNITSAETTTTIEDAKKNDTTTIEAKKEEIKVPSTDLSRLYYSVFPDNYNDASGISYMMIFYAYIDNGKLYYYKDYQQKNDYHQTVFIGSDKLKNYSKECSEISNVRRIKQYNPGTDERPTLFVITEEGNTYTIGINQSVAKESLYISQVLNDYKVEDIISMTRDDNNIFIFKVLLKDGTTIDTNIAVKE